MSEILLGTSVSGRDGAVAREAPAQASLAALTASGRATCINLRFHDDPSSASAAIAELPSLRLDARLASGAEGPRKPIVSEMLDVLASEAGRRGIRRIGIVNGDIVVTPEAIEVVAASSHGALAIARTDQGGDAPESLLRHGIDLFTFDTAFWQRERRRFRAYVLGEPVWDNVYAAMVACHGGAILSRAGLILHSRHPSAFSDSPYARYVQLLAARDSSYFSLWCEYVARIESLPPAAVTQPIDLALQRDVFRAPGLADAAVDVARAAWWRARQVFGA